MRDAKDAALDEVLRMEIGQVLSDISTVQSSYSMLVYSPAAEPLVAPLHQSHENVSYSQAAYVSPDAYR